MHHAGIGGWGSDRRMQHAEAQHLMRNTTVMQGVRGIHCNGLTPAELLSCCKPNGYSACCAAALLLIRLMRLRACSAAWSTWEARKAAQRSVLEAQARAKEAAFRAAMQVGTMQGVVQNNQHHQ